MPNLASITAAPRQHPVVCTFGALCLVVATFFYLLWSSQVADYPKEGLIYTLWLTPQAEVVPRTSFNPGAPTLRVSMDEFARLAASHQYLVTYDEDWLNPNTNPMRLSSSVTYFMRWNNLNLYAVDRIPAPYYFAYWTKRSFDGSSHFTLSTCSQSPQHQRNEGQYDHMAACGQFPLAVLPQPPALLQP